ncbi:MAG: DNA starvation/stationary phase protection protein [Actinomycetota bacterium]|nr:DNA starvation/stationary phase protection protein [Actinomycetota bacterium]
MPAYTLPGLDRATADKVCSILQGRLVALTDLHLTLKHIHWNVVGPNFIAVHEMLDPQVDFARAAADEVAERIAALGGEPMGTPGAVVKGRAWDDYDLNRAAAQEHLGRLDEVYVGVVNSHRTAFDELSDLDQVSSDMIVQQTQQLEQYQWFVRAHLEDNAGQLRKKGVPKEKKVSGAASRKRP